MIEQQKPNRKSTINNNRSRGEKMNPEGEWKGESLRRKAEKILSQKPQDVRKIPVEDIKKLIHELDVHQIELEMQNDELRKAQG